MDCRCIIESNWDFIGLMLIISFALIGFITVVEEIKNKYKK